MPVFNYIILAGKSVATLTLFPASSYYAGILLCVVLHYFNPSLPELYWQEIVYPYTLSCQYNMVEVAVKGRTCAGQIDP